MGCGTETSAVEALGWPSTSMPGEWPCVRCCAPLREHLHAPKGPAGFAPLFEELHRAGAGKKRDFAEGWPLAGGPAATHAQLESELSS